MNNTDQLKEVAIGTTQIFCAVRDIDLGEIKVDLVERLENHINCLGPKCENRELINEAADKIDELEDSRIKAIGAIAEGKYGLAHLLLQLPPKVKK